jgi:predicted double-glycine peptidase
LFFMRILPASLLFAALGLSGCASVGHFTGLRLNDDAVYVGDVTPVRQDQDHACGPACVAAVASHWGISFAAFKAAQPRMPEDATGHDLEALAGRLGLQAFAYRGSMDDLRQNLASGRPMIVMLPMPMMPRGGWLTETVLNLWNEMGPRPAHWVVVVGAIRHQQLIIDDPASGPMLVREEKFVAWWAQKENLCVLIAPRSDEPRRAD